MRHSLDLLCPFMMHTASIASSYYGVAVHCYDCNDTSIFCTRASSWNRHCALVSYDSGQITGARPPSITCSRHLPWLQATYRKPVSQPPFEAAGCGLTSRMHTGLELLYPQHNYKTRVQYRLLHELMYLYDSIDNAQRSQPHLYIPPRDIANSIVSRARCVTVECHPSPINILILWSPRWQLHLWHRRCKRLTTFASVGRNCDRLPQHGALMLPRCQRLPRITQHK